MTPKDVVLRRVELFNAGDADALAALTVRDGRIAFQRGYWDELSFRRLHGLPIPPR